MVIRIPVPFTGNADILELELIDPAQIDLLCTKCQSRNEFGSIYCAWCPAKLSPKSRYTTQALPQVVTGGSEDDRATKTLDLGDINDESLNSSVDGDVEPQDLMDQRSMLDRCASNIRQLVNLLNQLHYWALVSPAQSGGGMSDQRLEVLSLVRGLLTELYALATALMREEFRAKK